MKKFATNLAMASAALVSIFAATQAQAYDQVSEIYVTVPNYANKPMCLGAVSLPSGTKMKAGCKPEWTWFSRRFNSAPGDTEVVLYQYKDAKLTGEAQLGKPFAITSANTKVRVQTGFKY